jgi:hypothetical protein
VRTGVAIGMLDRLLHHGCLVTVGGNSSCPFAGSAGPVPFCRTDPGVRQIGALLGEWRILTQAPVATESPGRH